MFETILVFLISFGIAWSFVQKLTHEKQEFDTIALFSWTFSCGVCLLHSFLVEIFQPSDALASRYSFLFSLHILNLIFLIPLNIIWQFVSAFRIANTLSLKAGFTFFIWSFCFYLFWKMGSQLPDGKSDIFNMEAYIGRLGVFGVTILAILSGFGAVNSPYTTLYFFIRKINEDDILILENKLTQNMDIIFTKKCKLAESRMSSSQMNNSHPSKGFMSRFISNVSSSFRQREDSTTKALESELTVLEQINIELYQELENYHTERERLLLSNTLLGRYYNAMGYVFSIYCIWKVFSTSINLLFNRRGGVDPVTHGLNFIVHSFGWDIDVQLWSQQLSFLLVGVLVVVSIRGLLVQCMKAFRVLSRSISSTFVILCLAQIMGMYFLSTVLLMRMNVPPQYRKIITKVLGNIQFNFYHRWFDVIFLISALSSILFLYSVNLLHQQTEAEHRDFLYTTKEL